MNALNAIPILGWIIAAIIILFVTVPFYFLCNWLAPIYFYWLPKVYLEIPFWHMFGLLWLISSIRSLILPSFHHSSNSKSGSKS